MSDERDAEGRVAAIVANYIPADALTREDEGAMIRELAALAASPGPSERDALTEAGLKAIDAALKWYVGRNTNHPPMIHEALLALIRLAAPRPAPPADDERDRVRAAMEKCSEIALAHVQPLSAYGLASEREYDVGRNQTAELIADEIGRALSTVNLAGVDDRPAPPFDGPIGNDRV
jgi:hypothetical protein